MIIHADLRDELSIRMPGLDFAPYFSFVESCPLRNKENSEYHHILPRKEFPSHLKNVDNLIYLAPADHLRAHYWLALCAPKCDTFQRTFFLMAGLKKYASSVTNTELRRCADVYEQGRQAVKENIILRRPRFVDIVGKTIGRLRVLRSVRTKSGRPAWECSCSCGTIATIDSASLLSRGTKSCGCARGGRNIDITNQLFGRLTAVKRVENSEPRSRWICTCSCGGITTVRLSELKAGKTRYCGCLRKEINCKRGPEILKNYVQNNPQLLELMRNSQGKRLHEFLHNHWHVNRNIINPDCKLCQPQENQNAT